ncbi:ATP-binding protein [Parabacteroides sp. PF5-9]|uniref:ATP-binding protein n=1 Tax=Parabacteroides sp. PF5-9 TaxID=1742404 RepID=UPI002475AE88|nr:ATP-binding protein [Parabacteroides sp. PF5-9]MDH6357079.1 signal transduction histidine kinase [Parabacteroides sp. PF5-9]
MPKKTLKIRPYARLLTMLGEQLIKNEQIALAELIKNAYDADADWVKVSFVDFLEKNNKLVVSDNSKIIIEDNGSGMTLDTIEKSWMNPATPNKKAATGKEKRTPLKNRVIQGEKGIGRFAILKLGRKIAITTRIEDGKDEYIIDYDLSVYDDDFLTIDGKEKELYIDDISINVYSEPATQIVDRVVTLNNQKFTENAKGTRIEISNLKGEWDRKKIEEVSKESQKLQSIFDKIFGKQSVDKFEIGFEINNERVSASDRTIEELSNLLQHNSVLKITEGKYKEKERCFEFYINNNPFKLILEDAAIAGLSIFKEHFVSNDLFNNPIIKNSSCGNFSFNFFIFDFQANKDSIYYLDSKEKELVKEHRIYLYRDKIRVAPYGDPDDDWVGTDKKRALARSGDYLSNDQVVGFVDITKKDNPRLKDKTNREGLIEDGSATKDFIVLLQTFLRYTRLHPYAQYKNQLEQVEQQKMNKLRVVDSKFEVLRNSIGNNTMALQAYNDVVKSYKIEQDFYKKQLDTTTDLAGVGLSVETASHDIMMMLEKGMEAIDNLIKDIDGDILTEKEISEELLKIRGIFSFVDTQMKDIQLLFKSSKQRRRSIRVSDILDKVITIYKRTLQREHIELSVDKKGSPVNAKCTDAILLQLLINLFDNAVYWLSVVNIPIKKICVTLDGENQQLIFSDNGPGIREDDKPYIFEAFYSGKEEGRGLGLYIAKQLLTRLGYSIDLADIPAENILEGANFVVNFIKSDEI